MSPRIKMCGLTRAEDAALAHAAGAWALGFIFYPKSKRYITPAAAAAIAPADAQTVGVFVNQMPDIDSALKSFPLSAVQLHGDETPADARALRNSFGGTIIKAFRLQKAEDTAQIAAWRDAADYILVDAAVAGEYGGTGHTADWTLATATKHSGLPLILSGGIDADNITAAQEAVAPFAFDLASGVESAPGIKDAQKIKTLFDISRRISA
ncbi:MAG TPA: phosphoribosylanthranilate isomerase [Alphaproteobacteria bacterium]|nr:phosphoribosylanthranilate isomerase [Alphaproteobacteria bacterium]